MSPPHHPHHLTSRSEAEVTWFQRRAWLQAAAGWVALGGAAGALAQERSNIVQLTGDALLNGRRLEARQTIQTGDIVETGPGSLLQFVVGSNAFHLRQNTRVVVERGNTLSAVSILRMLTGAVVSVWGRGGNRQIVTPTLTAGIRGTGVYTEVMPGDRTYFCNCYGTVALDAGRDAALSRADYHEAFWAEPQALEGRLLRPAPAINHTDEELEFLAALVSQRTAWQVKGKPAAKRSGY